MSSSNRMNISNLLSPAPIPTANASSSTPSRSPYSPPKIYRTESGNQVYGQHYSQPPPPPPPPQQQQQPTYQYQYHQQQLPQSQSPHQSYGSPAALLGPSPLSPRTSPPTSSTAAGANNTTSNRAAPRSRKKEAPLLQRAVTSPHHYDRNITPSLAPNPVTQAQNTPEPLLTNASTISTYSTNTPGVARLYAGAVQTPAADYRLSSIAYGSVQPTPPPVLPRQTSTEKMDFLAGDNDSHIKARVIGSETDQEVDVASMQQTQQSQARSVRASFSVHDLPRSPQPPPLSRRTSALPSAADHMMSDAPTTTVQPRTFRASTLTTPELQKVSELTKQLSENSFLYESHTKLIKILQEGLRRHIAPPSANMLQNPHEYSLLPELRQARDAMDSRFPVGEDLWVEWIQDECMLAQTSEERGAVMELCQKAVHDEVGSTKLWRLYGDWMLHLYKCSHDTASLLEISALESHPIVGQVLARQKWSEEDKIVGPDVFRWDTMMDVWRSGVQATKWHINDSHVVWDSYIEILLQDLQSQPSLPKVDEIKGLFINRLRTPHATWDDTSSMFSTFISRYDNASYETIMVETSKQAAAAKQEFALRQDHEQMLAAAAESGDQDAEWTAMNEYLEWEFDSIKNGRSSPASFDLYISLFERAHLRFPTDAELWEDHIDVITEHARAETQLAPLTYNATRHCPWSGNLWAKRLVALESYGVAFEEMEDAKHHATSSGLLESVGGIDEFIKVQTAWCGFLRRRAFSKTTDEDEVDMAEVGITSAIEGIKALGERKEGKNKFKGDPEYRVERIHIKFLSQAERFDEARAKWWQLSFTHGAHWEFWERFYTWEISIWGRSVGGKKLPSPAVATKVLFTAMQREDLDWPEKMIEMYLHHCRQHEAVLKVQEATVEARRSYKILAKRRQQEAVDAAIAQAPAQQQYQTADLSVDPAVNGKRKLEELELTDEHSMKRSRAEGAVETETATYAASSSATSQVKRNRENATIIVKNVPADVTEGRLRQYFRDCGFVNNVMIIPDDNNSTATATLEFETKEDVLAAVTKNMKSLDGNAIEIQIGSGTTLYVTNYPEEADETYIRDLFSQFGDIVEVRQPSLKYNTHRRFCYVQFLSSSAAKAAESLDGKALQGGKVLSAKLSDPSKKKKREGALQEGREVCVKNVSWSASEDALRTIFELSGTVQNVRIPRNVRGQSQGIAFVIFSTKEEADKAVVDVNLKDFMGRILSVELAIENQKGPKRIDKRIIDNGSPAPATGSAGSPGTTDATTNNSSSDHRARTLRLCNIPDTVNSARIRALAEPYGQLKQVKLFPEKGEALVEYEVVADVGKAEMGLQGKELNGVPIQIKVSKDGSLTGGPGHGGAGGADGNTFKAKKGPAATATMPFAPVTRRPQQPGKRGGLGVKRGGGAAVAAVAGRRNNSVADKDDTPMKDEQDAGTAGGKSNDDFRKMMAGDGGGN